jgi:hypothetical protein
MSLQCPLTQILLSSNYDSLLIVWTCHMSLPLGVAMTDVDTQVIRGIVVSLSM